MQDRFVYVSEESIIESTEYIEYTGRSFKLIHERVRTYFLARVG